MKDREAKAQNYFAAFAGIHSVMETTRFIATDQTGNVDRGGAGHFTSIRFHQRRHGMVSFIGELLSFHVAFLLHRWLRSC